MSQRVLVTYGTRTGSTVAVANAIGDVLAARGFSVTVKPVKDKPWLDGYQAAVIGSAIRMGSWLPEAVVFARDNQARLTQLPTAIFTVHLLNTGDDAASRAARQAYTGPVRKFLTPRAEAFFTGKLDMARLGFLDRMLAKAANAGDGDQRDWGQVRGWAQNILS